MKDKMVYYRALYRNKYYVLPSVSYIYYEVVVCRLPKRYAHIIRHKFTASE